MSRLHREHAGAFPAVDNAANIASVVHLFDERGMLGELRLKEIANGAKTCQPQSAGIWSGMNAAKHCTRHTGFRHAIECDMAIVVRERRHARIRNRSVLLHEAGVGKRLMQGESIERVAMQVENISRCGFKWHGRSPLLDAAGRAGCCSVHRSAPAPRIGAFVQSSDMIVPFFNTASFFLERRIPRNS